MTLELTDTQNPAAVTLNTVLAVATHFTPAKITDHIERLLGAKITTAKGEVREDPRSVESGLKMVALFQQMALNGAKGASQPERQESDIETQGRLANSPAAQRAMAHALADTPEGRAAMEAALSPRKKGSGKIVDAEPGE